MLTGFKPISEAKGNNFIVIVGPPGTGKTTLGSTWPKPMGIYSVNDDGGLVVIKNKYKDNEVAFLEYSEKATNVGNDVHNIGFVNGISVGKTDAVQQLKDKILSPLEALSPEKQPYKTLLIDTYSELEVSLVKKAMLDKKSKLSLTEMKTLVGDPLLILRDRLVRFANEKNVLVVVLTHIKWKELNLGLSDGQTELKAIPNMTENNGARILQKADLALFTDACQYTYDDKTVEFGYVAFVGAHPFVTAKFRTSPKDNVEIPIGIMIPKPTYENITKLRQELNDGKSINFPHIYIKEKEKK